MSCARCGVQPGTVHVCAQDWCEACWFAFREPIITRVIIDVPSVLVRVGIDRPEHGPGMVDVECNACGATMVGIPGESCAYCLGAWERMARWQAEKLLRPELPDPDDARFPQSAGAWLERLTVALRAGIITETQLRAAWERRVVAVAAA